MSANKVIDISSLRVINSLIQYIIKVNNDNLIDMGMDVTGKDSIEVKCLIYDKNNVFGINSIKDDIYMYTLFYEDVNDFSRLVEVNVPSEESIGYKNAIKDIDKDVEYGNRGYNKLVRIR